MSRADEWNLPWNNFYWDITPKVPTTSVSSDITVNSVIHTDQHVRLQVPVAFPVSSMVVIANATDLPLTETMMVRVMLDAPVNEAVATVVAVGGQISASKAPVVGGQWVYFNVSSTVSTFLGQVVNLKIDFLAPPLDGHDDGSDGYRDATHSFDPIRHRGAKVGAIVGGTIGGVVALIALVSCCVCLGRKHRRARMARMAAVPSAPTSGEPSMYLPPAYRV